MRKSLFLLVCFVMLLNAQFTRTSTILDGESPKLVLLADFDNDDDLDLFISSTTATGTETKIVRNDNGVFSENLAILSNSLVYAAKAGDFENDGDIDLLVSFIGTNGCVIFKNENNSFIRHETGLSGNSMTNWGDLDNDGDLDLYNSFRIYKYVEGEFTFTQTLESLPYYWWVGEDYDESELFDTDRDGDLDILLSGDHMWSREDALPNYYSGVITHRNNIDIDSLKLGGNNALGYLAYGDLDNDGIQESMSTRTYYMDYQMEPALIDSTAYSYLIGSDIDESEVLPYNCGIWGDLDNDGDLDFTATGFDDAYYGRYSTHAYTYRNNTAELNTMQVLCSIDNGECLLGDIDNDSDLDIILYSDSLYIFKNSCSVVNNPPAAPGNLSVNQSDYNAVLSWDSTTDTETPSDGLSYNIYVRSETGSCDIISPMSNITNGYRKFVGTGNAGQLNSYTIRDLQPGTYYWSVQAIDHSYAGSQFTPEQTFTIIEIPVPDVPTALEPTEITNERFTANWSVSANATGYMLDVATDSLFSSCITGFQNYDAGNTVTRTIIGLTTGTDYFYRVCAYNSLYTSGYSDTIHAVTDQTPPSPDSLWATTIKTSEFKANWSAVPGVEGYQLDVANDSLFSSYLTGYQNLDVGNVTSKVISGLVSDSTYFFRLRSYLSGHISDNSDTLKVYIPIIAPPTASEASSITSSSFIANWEVSTGATGYFIDVATDSLFSNFVTGFENLNVGSVNAKTVTGLEMQKNYYYRVRATDGSNISDYSNVIHVSTAWQIFSDTGTFTWNVSSPAWGDYDNDGDLDLTASGKLYRNEGSFNFTQIDISMPVTDNYFSEWGDYNNDGYLDLLCLEGTSSPRILKIMKNNGDTTFSKIDTGASGYRGSFGDIDNDGDLDIISFYGTSRIYINNTGIFTEQVSFNKYCSGWFDYDNDGDIDIVSYEGFYVNNNDGSFTYKELFEGELRSYGDYNNDGFPDISTSWRNYYDYLFPEPYDCDYRTKVYKYNSGTGTYSSVLTKTYDAPCSVWGDYNNDGNLDIILSGTSWYSDPEVPPWEGHYVYTTQLYSSNSVSLSYVQELNQTVNGLQLVDIDNDGKLDLFTTRMLRNNSSISNMPPGSPSGLSNSIINASSAILSWNAATDAETAQAGLSYNVYIGTSPGSCDVVSASSDISTGYRRVVKTGNAGANLDFEIKNLISGTYYWSVQAIDHGYAGSEFAPEQSFTIDIPDPAAPTAIAASDVGIDRFRANWNVVDYAVGYFFDVSTDSLFSTYLSGFENKDVSNVNYYELTELSEGIRYYYRLRAYNLDGAESGYSNVISVVTQIADIISSSSGSIAWGDLNNDGLSDIFMSGGDPAIYKNKGDGTFEAINTGLTLTGSISLCDYDNDGFIDMFCGGKLYQNNRSCNFSDTGIIFSDIIKADWGDYDNDGDQDMLGISASSSKIYRNDSGIFTDINAGLTGLYNGDICWFDYDNDSDLDIIIKGQTAPYEATTEIYANVNGVFSLLTQLSGLDGGSVDCGDYNNDGFTDILLTGYTEEMVMDSDDNFGLYAISRTILYRNNGNSTFTNVSSGITAVFGSGIFSDYDNDGLLDIIVSGRESHYVYQYPVSYSNETKIYKNIGNGTFTDLLVDELDGFSGNLAVADYDRDLKPDLLFSGMNSSSINITKIFDCGASSTNTPPSAPSNLSAIQSADNSLTFSWDKATDAETPQNGLSYNLFVGTESTTGNTFIPMSDITTGYRRVVGLGNAQQDTTWTINGLTPGTYYWSVQAIDHSYAGSVFAPEQTVIVTGIEENIPLTTELYQNYPNPFNPATEIKFSLAESSKVNLSVYNTNGQLVKTLVDGKTEKGYHSINFDASELNSGIYFYQLDVNGNVQTKKMIMLK